MADTMTKISPTVLTDMTASLSIDYTQTKKIAFILRAINHKLRQDIIKLLHENKLMTVTAIYQALQIEQSVASQYLGILRRAKIVTAQRNGKFIYYGLNYERLEAISTFTNRLLKEK